MKNIGFQIIGNQLTDDVIEALSISSPSTIGFVDPDIGTVARVKEVVGDRVTLWGRLVRDDLTIDNMTVERARSFAQEIIRKADELDRQILIWQSANEVLSNGANTADISRVASFDLVFGRELKKEGLQALGTAFGTGKPYTGEDGTDVRWWRHYWPALEEVWLNVHEYWHYHEPNYGVPWHVGRLLRNWSQWPEDLRKNPVMISELGWEVVPGQRGWHGTVDAEAYLRYLEDYSKKLPYNFAASLFAVVAGRWSSYDIRPILHLLVEKWQSETHVWPIVYGTRRQVNLVGSLPTHPNKRYEVRDLDDIDKVVVHHTATHPGSDIVGHIRAIARYHITSNRLAPGGAPGIAYHRVIAPDGTIYLTQPLEAISWHARELNRSSIGIAVLGNFQEDQPTQEQVESLRWQIQRFNEVLGKNLEIKAHSDLGYTVCPGQNMIRYIEELRRPGQDMRMVLIERIEQSISDIQRDLDQLREVLNNE